MPKPNTIKDLMAAGDVSRHDVEEVARVIFNSDEVNYPASDALDAPYDVTLPDFDNLPDAARQFVIKALLECTVVNTLDRVRDPSDEAE